MANFESYDLGNVKENDFEVIPVGEYPAIITECNEKKTKDGAGKYLSLKVQIVAGKYQNRSLYDNLNTENKSAQCQQIGRAQLKSILVALNKVTAKDSGEILNKKLTISTKIGKDQNGNPQTQIKGYKAFLPTTSTAKQVEKNLVEQAFEEDSSEATKTTTRVNPYA